MRPRASINLRTGMVQAWPMPAWNAPAAGLLSPRPGVAPPQAYATYQPLAHQQLQAYQTPTYQPPAPAYQQPSLSWDT
jgi:hypothetical protein